MPWKLLQSLILASATLTITFHETSTLQAEVPPDATWLGLRSEQEEELPGPNDFITFKSICTFCPSQFSPAFSSTWYRCVPHNSLMQCPTNTFLICRNQNFTIGIGENTISIHITKNSLSSETRDILRNYTFKITRSPREEVQAINLGRRPHQLCHLRQVRTRN